MSYTHLTKTELVFIEEYHELGHKGLKIAERLDRGHEAVYRVIRQLKEGLTAIDVYRQYLTNKARCGRKKMQLTETEKEPYQRESPRRLDARRYHWTSGKVDFLQYAHALS